jgi:hypothetical protein
MTNNQMFIPEKIKIGYQNRNGTYTGKLAYVIYFDNKGILRKEKSWESWRDKKIIPQEFSNEPTDGFVLNKGVGGVRDSYNSWNTRSEYIRIYDPRDFEFEISVANLLFILQETSSIKGKGLEGEFVYAWNGTELVLLPVESAEYISCKEHTARQSKKLCAKDIKPGFSFLMKNGTTVLYLGKYPYNTNPWYGFHPIGNRHIFVDIEDYNPLDNDDATYIVDTGFTKLAESVSSTPLSFFPDELDKFKKSKYYGEIVSIELVPVPTPSVSYRDQCIIFENNLYYNVVIRNTYYGNREYTITKSVGFIPELINNKITLPPVINNGYEQPLKSSDFEKLKFYSIMALTPEGTKIEIRQ